MLVGRSTWLLEEAILRAEERLLRREAAVGLLGTLDFGMAGLPSLLLDGGKFAR